MTSFAKDLIEESKEEVGKFRATYKKEHKGEECCFPYAVDQVLKKYSFPDPKDRQELRKKLLSECGKAGAKKTNSIKRNKAKRKYFEEYQTSIHLVA